MALIARSQRGLFISLFGTFTLFGTSMTMVGASLPKILGDFHWSYSAAGAVIAMVLVRRIQAEPHSEASEPGLRVPEVQPVVLVESA